MSTTVSLAVLVALAASSRPAEESSPWRVEPLEAPGDATARWPNLTRLAGAEGELAASWIEVDGSGHRLRVARLGPAGWSAPATVARGDHWFVNWADVPALAASGERLMATWLGQLGEGTYAYGVSFAISVDGGASWSEPALLHADRSPTEHGFASLAALSDGRFAAVWLDGRAMLPDASGHAGGAMAIRTTVVAAATEAPSVEVVLDDRVCECCPTTCALVDDGTLVVAFRDRSESEVRDIGVVRGRPGEPDSWSRARFERADDWTIAGCPVNGPALAARTETVALAWYTGAGGRSRVRLALSPDRGASFGAPIEVDAGNPVGRADVVVLDDGSVVVTWMEFLPDGGPSWMARCIGADGSRGGPVRLGPADGDRKAGYLRVELLGETPVCVWTDGEAGGLRAARLLRK